LDRAIALHLIDTGQPPVGQRKQHDQQEEWMP
jgi:hypothetical protein